jgi:DNA-binding MarR family transcriptional regulator
MPAADASSTLGSAPPDARTDDVLTLLEGVVIGAVGLTARSLAEAAPGIDLTFPQWRAILIVGAHSDGLRVGRLAARVGVTLPATSRLLRRLERRGLLTLAPDPDDGRATRACLTPAGLALRGAILAYRHAQLEKVADEVAVDEGHVLAALATALGRYG